ncbi:hypothetical protein MHYP_G00185010 [Metynnis hypsauchen]
MSPSGVGAGQPRNALVFNNTERCWHIAVETEALAVNMRLTLARTEHSYSSSHTRQQSMWVAQHLLTQSTIADIKPGVESQGTGLCSLQLQEEPFQVLLQQY